MYTRVTTWTLCTESVRTIVVVMEVVEGRGGEEGRQLHIVVYLLDTLRHEAAHPGLVLQLHL